MAKPRAKPKAKTSEPGRVRYGLEVGPKRMRADTLYDTVLDAQEAAMARTVKDGSTVFLMEVGDDGAWHPVHSRSGGAVVAGVPPTS